MKKSLKALFAFFEDFINSIISILCVVIWGRKVKRLSKYRSTNSDSCVVLGNGPSLKGQLEKLKDDNTSSFMVVNDFYESTYYKELKPEYHVLIDPIYYRTARDAYEQDIQTKFIDGLNSIDWRVNVILPVEFKHSPIKNLITNKNINFIFINVIPVKGYKWLRYILYDRCLGMPRPQNVLNAAIYCAIVMKYSVVRIYGADHSWSKDIRVNSMNKVCYADDHFYDKKNYRVINTKIADFFQSLAYGFYSHDELRRYADSRGVEIYNCTTESFIDSYKRLED